MLVIIDVRTKQGDEETIKHTEVAAALLLCASTGRMSLIQLKL